MNDENKKRQVSTHDKTAKGPTKRDSKRKREAKKPSRKVSTNGDRQLSFEEFDETVSLIQRYCPGRNR